MATTFGHSKPSVYTDSYGRKIRVLSRQMGGCVYQIDDTMICKSGTRIKPSEAAALVLVQQHTDVPVPEFIKADFDDRTEEGRLFMGVVPGTPLEAVWNKIPDDATKRRLCDETWSLIRKLRRIDRPPECQAAFQCSPDGSTTGDPLLADLKRPPRPIRNDDDLRARIYERYLHFGGLRHAKELPAMLPRSSNAVFTHADIAPRNIMVDGTHPVRITGIIDWETAGWFPDYWEYANIMRPAAHGDWQDWMGRTAPQEFKADLAGINASRRVLF